MTANDGSLNPEISKKRHLIAERHPVRPPDQYVFFVL